MPGHANPTTTAKAVTDAATTRSRIGNGSRSRCHHRQIQCNPSVRAKASAPGRVNAHAASTGTSHPYLRSTSSSSASASHRNPSDSAYPNCMIGDTGATANSTTANNARSGSRNRDMRRCSTRAAPSPASTAMVTDAAFHGSPSQVSTPESAGKTGRKAHAFSPTWPASVIGRSRGYPPIQMIWYHRASQRFAYSKYPGFEPVHGFAAC